ncbi:MAG: flagellar basal body rod protein FlgC [Nannocystaceae bacterium]|nr:flagellar basal body rod protein FlgC [Nannocystaceae bacterium]
MTLLKTMDLTAAGMSAQRTRMNVAAMNLANKSTTRGPDGQPYRRREVVLEATPQDFGTAFASAMGPEAAMGVRVQDVVESNDAPMLVYDPGHPDADAAGYVAMPNVNPIAEMVNLMGAARAYEAGTSVLQTVRQMAEQALRIGR